MQTKAEEAKHFVWESQNIYFHILTKKLKLSLRFPQNKKTAATIIDTHFSL